MVRARSPGTTTAAALPGALALAVVVVGCDTPTAPARGQLVVWIDTNLVVPLFADTLRIEVLGADDTARDERTVSVGDPAVWPVSFGVAPRDPTARGDGGGGGTATGDRVRLRVRLYPAAYARRRSGALAASADPSSPARVEPAAYRTIDRLVALDPRPDRFARVTVVLAAECLGVPADLAANTTCVAAPSPSAPGGPWVVRRDTPATEGVAAPEPVAPDAATARPRSLVGSWADARALPCPDAPYHGDQPGALDSERCVPGGVFFLGDERLTTNPCFSDLCTAAPERLVRVSPFYIDTYEVTVARWRAAVTDTFDPGLEQWRRSDSPDIRSACTYGLGPEGGARYPMTCVSFEAARAFCEYEGRRRGLPGVRTLPTEAQWEFAASGRGQERIFAWGDDVVHDCDAAAYGRNASAFQDLAPGSECYAAAPTPGRYPALPDYVDRPTRDVSLDLVHDLSGNVSELTLDVGERYGVGCWAGTQMLVDPRCDATTQAFEARVRRGGAFYSAAGGLAVGQREISEPTVEYPTGAFRCVRNVVPR